MALLVVAGLSGCSTSQIDSIPKDFGGLPESAPKRAENPPAFPAVHDVPPPRTATLLDQEQQKRMESDLIAIRNRQPGQEKNRLREAQKKAQEEAKAKQAKEAKDKPKVKDPNKQRNKLAQQPATVANAPAAAPVAAPGTPPWPVPQR